MTFSDDDLERWRQIDESLKQLMKTLEAWLGIKEKAVFRTPEEIVYIDREIEATQSLIRDKRQADPTTIH